MCNLEQLVCIYAWNLLIHFMQDLRFLFTCYDNRALFYKPVVIGINLYTWHTHLTVAGIVGVCVVASGAELILSAAASV